MATIHVKFRGQSRDIELTELFPDNPDALVDGLSDIAIQEAVSSNLDIPPTEFNGYVVERHENGNATIHPQAEFGC